MAPICKTTLMVLLTSQKVNGLHQISYNSTQIVRGSHLLATLWSNTPILRDITFFELVLIVLAFMVWGLHLKKNNKDILHVDNTSLVHILNKQSAKSSRVIVLIKSLVLMALKHILGKSNINADSVFRKQWEVFWEADQTQTYTPNPFQPNSNIALTSHTNTLLNSTIAVNTRQAYAIILSQFVFTALVCHRTDDIQKKAFNA